jgi:hypothetical protein
MNFNYVPLAPFQKEPKEGRKAICFNIDMSATLTETVDIGLTGIEISQFKSIYINNLDPVANLTIVVAGTSQVIKCGAGKIIYLPLFSATPCRLIFSVNVLTTKFINVIVGNFDFDTIKPNIVALAAQDLTNGVTGAGAIVLANGPTINNLIVTGTLTLPGGVVLGTPVGEEVPTGVIDGVNPTFNLAQAPLAGSLFLFINGIKQKRTVAFTLAGNVITFLAGFIPVVGDTIEAYYRY